MPSSPHIDQREAVRYVAIAGSGTGDAAFRAFADRAFPAVFGAVGSLGLTPAAAPFFRLHRFVSGGEFEVEVGVPVAGGATAPRSAAEAQGATPVTDGSGVAGDAYVAELPAGRYAMHLHEGAYSADDETWAGRDLASAHRSMETWATEQGLRLATEDDGRLTAVVEQYLVGPAESSDVASWRTLIAKLVAE
jgi:hypothetical protein